MTKREFINKLEMRLQQTRLSRYEIKDILNYYDEMISDKMDAGYRENYIIAELGTIDEIVQKIQTSEAMQEDKKIKYESILASEEARNTTVAHQEKQTKSNTWWIVLLCLFPFWIGFAAGAFGILFGIVIALVSLVIVFFSFTIGGIIGLVPAFFCLIHDTATGIYAFGICVVLIGLGLIGGPLSLKLNKVIFQGIKKIFQRLRKKNRKGKGGLHYEN